MKKIDFKVLLPNLITLSGLSFGLSSIRFALEADFNLAIVCILLAGICDVLDGLLARHLHSESDLGAQLDSLSDFLSFGITRDAYQKKKNAFFLYFVDPKLYFFTFFESKKMRIDILRTSVQFSARELRSETISCIFG